ncbi:hypothetical protein BD779DRAFT_1789131 [Infundibulicybe gibba]|nr:hypothetical protein BD779DRAFT_1789131 [Infundibulicybe gibba]
MGGNMGAEGLVIVMRMCRITITSRHLTRVAGGMDWTEDLKTPATPSCRPTLSLFVSVALVLVGYFGRGAAMMYHYASIWCMMSINTVPGSCYDRVGRRRPECGYVRHRCHLLEEKCTALEPWGSTASRDLTTYVPPKTMNSPAVYPCRDIRQDYIHRSQIHEYGDWYWLQAVKIATIGYYNQKHGNTFKAVGASSNYRTAITNFNGIVESLEELGIRGGIPLSYVSHSYERPEQPCKHLMVQLVVNPAMSSWVHLCNERPKSHEITAPSCLTHIYMTCQHWEPALPTRGLWAVLLFLGRFRAPPEGRVDLKLMVTSALGTAMASPQREIQDPSPSISDIPPEVLGEIFLHCLLLKGWGSFSPCDAPWVLIKVCHLWKEVALSTPLLWSRLPFLSEERCCNGDGCLWLLELYLKNSAGAALTLGFEVPPDPEDATFLPLITPHLSRSQHLSISHDRELPGQKIYCVNYKDFPLLKSLELICSYSGVTSRALERSQLTTAGLRGIEFPWAQLTQLTIQISSSIEVLAPLRNCSSLQVCRLSPTPHGRRQVSCTLPKSKAVLPRLQTLVVEDELLRKTHLVKPTPPGQMLQQSL